MIDKENFHVLNFVKKEPLTGSMDGMRYQLEKGEGEDGPRLCAAVWPEPFSYIKTLEEKIERAEFRLSAEGVEEAADWLNERYLAEKPLWDSVR